MYTLLRFCLGLVLLAPMLAHAQSALDIPGNRDTLSGIGVISGWKCAAQGNLTISLDAGDPIPAAYGFPRGDTTPVCGDDGHNGFFSFFNWAILGDGTHTAVAYDNGVEFARNTFTVVTTGEEFLTGANGECTIPNFPAPGETTQFAWTEATQHLEMVAVQARSVTKSMTSPMLAHAQSALDIPGNGDTLSGIGVISGWKCAAQGNLTISLDAGDPIPAAYGFPRGDTTPVCGDDGHNGFFSFFNWAILGDGTHTAVAYDNGVEFARNTFTVVTTGEEFLTGANGECTIPNFPAPGETTQFAWTEATQHLEMVSVQTRAVDQSIVQYLTGPVEEGRSPGLIAAIIDEEGVRALASAGVRKQGSPEKLTVNDLVHIGSNTKAMTSTMLATLVADGTFVHGWQTTISQVFPELVDEIHAGYHSVTLWQLTSHTGGVVRNARNSWAHAGLKIKERRYALIKENLANPPAGPIGEYLYSNLGYMVAGAMGEKLTGKSWETLMEERLFAPLGMASAGFGTPGTPNEVNQPWGHRRDAGTSWVPSQLDNPAAVGPSGTVHVSIADWAKFIQLWFPNQVPRILDRDTLNTLVTPRSGDYAAGWGVYQRSWAAGTALSHAGSNTFWYSVLWVAPNLDRAYVAVANSVSADYATTANMLDSIIDSLISHSP